jgi:hypothetical protein
MDQQQEIIESQTPTVINEKPKRTRTDAQRAAVRRWLKKNDEYWKSYQLHKYHERMQNPEEREKLNAKARERYAKKKEERLKNQTDVKDRKERTDVKGRPLRFPDGYDGSLFTPRRQEEQS